MRVLRLFVAGLLPDEAKDIVCGYVKSLDGSLFGIRWEPREKLHVTLKFLGDVDQRLLQNLMEDIGASLRGLGRIKSGFVAPCFFPDTGKPRVLALRLLKNARFQSLFKKVQAASLQNGFKPERRTFVPHVTLGRMRGNFKKIGKIPEPREFEFSIRTIALVRSEFISGGSVYTNLKTWEL